MEPRAFQTVSAEWAGAKTKSVLPHQPRFLRELAVIPLEGGLMVDGSDGLQFFKGPQAQSFLPQLISLMDGGRTIGQLEAAFAGIPVGHVRAAISLLFNCGLVEEGAAQTMPAIPNVETLAFLRRYAATTSNNCSGWQAYERLRTAQVVIFYRGGALQQAEVLRLMLEESGIGAVEPVHAESLTTWHPRADTWEQSLVISLSFGCEDVEWHAELDDWCLKHRFSWLRAAMDEATNHMDIGPLFRGNESPCYRCFHEMHSRAPNSQARPTRQAQARNYFWISMVAIEIVYVLSRVGPPGIATDFRRYDLQNWQARALRCARVPGCPRCRPLARNTVNRLIDTAIVFEDYLALQSHTFLSAKTQREHTQLSTSLSKQAKRLPNCRQFALDRNLLALDRPVLDLLDNDSGSWNQGITLTELATVLLTTAGIRDSRTANERVQRWAATAGNLGSVELFVIVRSVEGLSPGLYFYQPQEHSLACFERRSGALEVEEFMGSVTPADPKHLPDVLVVFTGALHRVVRKYGAFGYRLINLDAGVALSQLHVVTRSLNICSRTATRWADNLLEDQLRLEPFGEQTTAVVELSRGTSRLAVKSVRSRSKSEPQIGIPRSTKAVRDFCELPIQQILEMLYCESRTNEQELQSETFQVPCDFLDAQPGSQVEYSHVVVSLPSPIKGGRSVGDVLAQRKSVRRFGRDSVTLGQVGTMLHYACQGDAQDWPDRCRVSESLTFLVLAGRVDGLNPGVYRYQPQGHVLSLFGDLPPAKERVELFVQSEFALGPLVLWIVGDLAAACSRDGAFGHRRLLLRAGIAGHRFWMAALGMGLSGSLIAGLVPSAARRLLRLDGYEQASLLAFTAGRETSRFISAFPS